jgi:hypothetical protein
MTDRSLMRKWSLLTTLGVATLLLVPWSSNSLASVKSLAEAHQARWTDNRCPSAESLRAQPERIEKVIAAVRRVVPQHYSDSEGFVIHYATWLGNTFGEATKLRRKAAAKCGVKVASLSWAVGLQFPKAPIASGSFSQAYFAHARTGWRLWMRVG